MREIRVTGLPEGLRRLVCDACGSRHWYHDGNEITDQQAVDLAAPPAEPINVGDCGPSA
jgi:hypothetical protein